VLAQGLVLVQQVLVQLDLLQCHKLDTFLLLVVVDFHILDNYSY
jgi:hypothetical protein